jgi:hypothetical protein
MEFFCQLKMRQSGAGRGGGHGSMQQKVIDVPSYHEVDKFIHKTENPYVLAIHDPNLKGTEKVLRQVREILNKLTPQKFNKLASDLIALDISTEERLKGVIDVIFEKAIDEPAFSQTYANLCKILSTVSLSCQTQLLAIGFPIENIFPDKSLKKFRWHWWYSCISDIALEQMPKRIRNRFL